MTVQELIDLLNTLPANSGIRVRVDGVTRDCLWQVVLDASGSTIIEVFPD